MVLLLQSTLACSLRNETKRESARPEEPILPAAEEFRALLSSFQACIVSRQWPESLLLELLFLRLIRIRFGLRGGAEGRERQNRSKKEKGIAKDQRLEFHKPSTLQI